MRWASYVGNVKTKLRARFDNYKTAGRSYRKKRKVLQQRFMNIIGKIIIMDWWLTVHINRTMWNTWADKRGGNIWQHGLKHFTLMAFMKRKNIYMKSSFLTFFLLGIQFFNHFNFYFCFCFLFSFFLISSIFFFFFFVASVKYLT